MSAGLRRRLLSALVFAPAALALAIVGGWALEAALLALAAFGGREISTLIAGVGFRAPRAAWLLAPISFLAALHLPGGSWIGVLGWLVWSCATLWLFFPWTPPADRGGAVAALFHGAAGLYVGLLAAALCRLTSGPWSEALGEGNGSHGLLIALLGTWACDSGAYAAGFTFGGAKLWPAVSPKKTWAGAIGGFAAALVVTWLLGPRWFPGLTALEAIGVGAAIGSLAQLGDLFESRLKRSAGVKDAGNFLPGHGGVLDRFDSLLYVGPVVGLLLARLAR